MHNLSLPLHNGAISYVALAHKCPVKYTEVGHSVVKCEKVWQILILFKGTVFVP